MCDNVHTETHSLLINYFICDTISQKIPTEHFLGMMNGEGIFITHHTFYGFKLDSLFQVIWTKLCCSFFRVVFFFVQAAKNINQSYEMCVRIVSIKWLLWDKCFEAKIFFISNEIRDTLPEWPLEPEGKNVFHMAVYVQLR